MSDIITARDPDIIAAEINTIKEQVQKVLIYASIEIGGKLTEAKGLVPQGEWGRWLEKNVEYSQSTAENMMKLYREYGGNQESLFDTWTKSETFGKLTYTQHLALLALPFSDRQEFAEQNNVEEMSTRQLLKAVQDQLEQERRDHEQTEARARDAEQNVVDMQQRLSAAKSSEDAWQSEIDKITAAKKKAEQKNADNQKKVEDLKKQLKEAKLQEEAAREDLKKVKEQPEIPESMMEQLRQEAEAAAAEKAALDIQKQLEAAEEARKAAEQKKQEAEAELVAAQKRLNMADPDMMEYTTLIQKMVSDYNVVNGLRKKISVHDREKGEKCRQILKKMLDLFVSAVDETK